MSSSLNASLHANAATAHLEPAPLDLALPIAAAPAPQRRRMNPWLLGGATAGALLLAGGTVYLLTASKMEVTDVVTSNVLVGNGRPQATQLRYSASRAEIRAIDVRFVRGDGAYNPTNWTVPVDSATRDAGSLNAGTLSPVAAAPQRLTFEYTLVDRDGKRSAPFEKTFAVVPPPRIAQLNAPTRLSVGQALNVSLNYQRGGSDVVKLQQRVVESDVAWPNPEKTVPVQLGQAQGLHQFQVELPPQAQRSTLEFTLVDAAGAQSEPVRLSVSAGAAGPVLTYGTVVSVSHLGGASGLGAVGGAVAGGALGNRFGGGRGRTAMTVLGAVGGAFAGHQIEQNVRGESAWETTVQMDGGGVRRFRHSSMPRWAAGSRVRVAGNSIQG